MPLSLPPPPRPPPPPPPPPPPRPRPSPVALPQTNGRGLIWVRFVDDLGEEDGPHRSGATASSKGNIPKSQRRSGSALGSGEGKRVALRSSERVQKLAQKDGEERAPAIAKQSQSNAAKSSSKAPPSKKPASSPTPLFSVQQTSPPSLAPTPRAPRLPISAPSHKAARPAAGHRKATKTLPRLLSHKPVPVPDLGLANLHHHRHHQKIHHHRRRRPRTSSARRAEQNRSAQRAFRERRLQYVKSLEEQLSVVSTELADAERIKQENSELQRLIRNLQRENALLRKVAVGAGGDVPDAVSLSPTDSDDADSSNADIDGSSPEQVPQDPDYGATEPLFSAALVGDLDGVYDLSRLKHEAGEGSRAYDAVLAHIGPDGRLRRSLKMELALSADSADADAEIDALDPLAYAARSADTDPAAAEPFYDLSALKPAGIARDLAGETAFGPAVTDKRLVSDGFGTAIFPLITPPLSDTSTPAYSGYGLSLDTPEHDGGLFDDAGEVPSVRRFPSSASSAGDVATPPQDGPHRLPATADAASSTAATAATSKRPLRDAEIYTTDEPQCSKTALTRNETFDRDPVEEELCERMRAKALLGEVDPSAFNKSKFIKKTTSS